ncbi:MAG: hypothetical protein Ta2G_13360 [Termitinemataceae bacterium]|nr:MAG: hypothetical protein Ta2G_13360 [Termitinemataceae bacterium]
MANLTQKIMANLTRSKRRYTENTRFDDLFFPLRSSVKLCVKIL